MSAHLVFDEWIEFASSIIYKELFKLYVLTSLYTHCDSLMHGQNITGCKCVNVTRGTGPLGGFGS